MSFSEAEEIAFARVIMHKSENDALRELTTFHEDRTADLWQDMTQREIERRGVVSGGVEDVRWVRDEDEPCCPHPVHWGRFGCASCRREGGPCQPEDNPRVDHEHVTEGSY